MKFFNRKFVYYITYHEVDKTNNSWGFGSSEIHSDEKIKTWEDVQNIKKVIVTENNLIFSGVVITNWKLLRKE